MKRIGRFLFCLLPLIITIVLQNLIIIPICGITLIVLALKISIPEYRWKH